MNKNMIFNITHHEYVPQHTILSKEEEILQNKFKDIHKSLSINTQREVESFTSSIGTLFLKNNKHLLGK